MKVVSDGT